MKTLPHPPAFLLTALVALQLVVQPRPSAIASDYVLTIGGGFSPAGNQMSLERNVVFFRKLLQETYADGVAHDLLFADGDSPNPDINYLEPGYQPPRANLLAALVFGRENNLNLKYRDNRLENIDAMSTPHTLEKWFNESGSKLETGDRLILYVTAHGGGSSDRNNKGNTKLYMWNGSSIDAKTLAGHLKKLPEDVEVITVMVQCFSGGFANLLFDEVDSSKGPGARPVAGFFATVPNRIAAGCTPDINEETYDEFSSHFWAAIRGSTRTDKDVPSADYDGDGRVSFEEAHAYTLLTSLSIDIPLKTTDTFLRAHSKTKGEEYPDLLGVEDPYFQLLAKASPVELAILDGLSARLGLDGVDRVALAREAAEKLSEERKKLQGERDAGQRQFNNARRQIQIALKNRWPGLENTNSPFALELFTSRSAEFVQAVEEHPAFKAMMEGREKRVTKEAERLEVDKKWAHHQRFLRAVETLVLAQNLSQVADESIQQRFADLLARERSSLGATPALAEQKADEEPAEETAEGADQAGEKTEPVPAP